MEYNNYDSFNDRDNRFQVKNYSIDYAAGSGYHRNESGKKLFHDKYKFNSIFPNNSSEKEYRNTHSNESLKY